MIGGSEDVGIRGMAKQALRCLSKVHELHNATHENGYSTLSVLCNVKEMKQEFFAPPNGHGYKLPRSPSSKRVAVTALRVASQVQTSHSHTR